MGKMSSDDMPACLAWAIIALAVVFGSCTSVRHTFVVHICMHACIHAGWIWEVVEEGWHGAERIALGWVCPSAGAQGRCCLHCISAVHGFDASIESPSGA